jgi:hypothetical protein
MGNKELIEQAQAALVSEPKLTKDNTKAVEASDATLMNELLALRTSLDENLKALTAEKKRIDDIIKDAIGKNDELLVHGAKIASISRWRQTDVVAEVVKEMFAVKDYPELYKRSDRSKLTIH